MNAAFAALLTMSVAALPEIANPGFDEINAQTGLPRGWEFTCLPGEQKLIRYSAPTLAAGQEGEGRALSIRVSPDHPDRNVGYNAYQDVVDFAVGKKYSVSAKVQTQGLRTLPKITLQ